MRPATVDALIIENGKILLIKRGREPDKGKWALPGGFVDRGETAEEACVREVEEETGLEVEVEEIVGVFSEPERDPRRTISIAYLCRKRGGVAMGGDDAGEAGWFLLDELPELAFDHGEIIGCLGKK
ncbi:NUDIX domain-containing protein [Candidatus Micrarchaeota archaeon]|nr:NUDIX domain-containing protein [Candidatus Micrarchaeota archaeon]